LTAFKTASCFFVLNLFYSEVLHKRLAPWHVNVATLLEMFLCFFWQPSGKSVRWYKRNFQPSEKCITVCHLCRGYWQPREIPHRVCNTLWILGNLWRHFQDGGPIKKQGVNLSPRHGRFFFQLCSS
jgi:hypothetical protein